MFTRRETYSAIVVFTHGSFVECECRSAAFFISRFVISYRLRKRMYSEKVRIRKNPNVSKVYVSKNKVLNVRIKKIIPWSSDKKMNNITFNNIRV